MSETSGTNDEPVGILFASKDNTAPYGSTHSFLIIAEHLRTLGCRLGMFTFPQGYLDQTAAGWQIPRNGYRFDWQKRRTSIGRLFALITQNVSVIWNIRKLLREGSFQVVYTNTVTHVAPVLAGWLFRKKVVVHVREGEDYFSTSGPFKRRLIFGTRNSILKRCVDRYFCVSQHVADTVNQSLGVTKAQAIHNGVEPSDFADPMLGRDEARRKLGLEKDDFVVICAGRMHKEKAIGNFVNAAVLAAKDTPNLRAIAIGGPHDTPYFLNEVKVAADAAPDGVITLPGYCNNMPEYYAACDLFIHPATYDEPLARTILEAMAARCCIVATNVGGTPEMLEDGRTGFLVPPGDCKAIADRITSLSQQPELRGKVASAAQADASERFTSERYALAVQSELTELVGRDLDRRRHTHILTPEPSAV